MPITSEGLKCDVCGKWILLPLLGVGKAVTLKLRNVEPLISHDTCADLVTKACESEENWRNFPEGPLKEAFKEVNEAQSRTMPKTQMLQK